MKLRGLVLSGLLAAMVAPAASAQGAGTLEFGLFARKNFYGESYGLRDRTGPGARIGFFPIRGIEIEAAFYPTRNLQIAVGHTFSDTYFRKNLVGSDTGEALDPALFRLSGRNLSNAPVRVQTASLTWTPELTSGGIKGLVYVDGRVTSGYNTGSDLFPEKFQGGYAIVNARLGLRGPQGIWGLEVFAQNLFNKNYYQVAFNTPFQGAGSIAQTQAFGTTANQLFSAFLAEPRTYGVTARTRF